MITRGMGTFNWPPPGTATWPLTWLDGRIDGNGRRIIDRRNSDLSDQIDE